jgi:O-6-methylguanine DNA methyltransferase
MRKRPLVFLVKLPVPTPDGVFIAHYSEEGLAGLEFPTEKAETLRWRVRGFFGRAFNRVPTSYVCRWHTVTAKALKAALSGRVPTKLPPLDLSCGTVFQRRLWSVLRKIAAGQTLSYQQVARRIGRPKAVRAVGGACDANPIPVLIPCHRVLASDGRVGGFSAGLRWKRLLLAREGVEIRR